jgi:hypothetical protein
MFFIALLLLLFFIIHRNAVLSKENTVVNYDYKIGFEKCVRELYKAQYDKR